MSDPTHADAMRMLGELADAFEGTGDTDMANILRSLHNPKATIESARSLVGLAAIRADGNWLSPVLQSLAQDRTRPQAVRMTSGRDFTRGNALMLQLTAEARTEIMSQTYISDRQLTMAREPIRAIEAAIHSMATHCGVRFADAVDVSHEAMGNIPRLIAPGTLSRASSRRP